MEEASLKTATDPTCYVSIHTTKKKKSIKIFEFTHKFMKKNRYENSNMIKECLAVGSSSFRNKTEICKAIDWSIDLRVLSAECEMCQVTMNSK